MSTLPTPLQEEAEPAPAKPVFTRVKLMHDLLAEGNQVQRVLKQWRRPDLARTITKFRIWTNANESARERLKCENEQLLLDVKAHREEVDRLSRALSLEKQRAARWCSLADTTPSSTRPYIVAAPAPHRAGLITLRRTFLYIGDGVWGVHGKMESTRTDITHFRELPPPPDELE